MVKRILVGLSGTAYASSAMRQFIEMRAWSGVQIAIVTFGKPPAIGQHLLDDAATFCRSHGFQPELRLVSGNPIQELLSEAADWGADLIVMGNSARSVLMQKLFGDTALHVIQNADRPLMLSQ